MAYTISNSPIDQVINKNVEKSHLYGLMGSALSCIILFLFMWFYIMPYATIIEPIEEEGIMVSFGDNEFAGGMGSSSEPLAAPTREIIAPAIVHKQIQSPAKEQLITQNDNSNAIAEQRQKDQERYERQQIEKQKTANENRIAQQKRNEQEAINKASSVNGLFGNGSITSGIGNGKGSGSGTGGGSGKGSGEGIQGNPAGHGNLGGNSWSLSGRSLTGRLTSPNYEENVEGKITVNIRVNESGSVVSTTIGSPTTIGDAETRNAAISAARSTRFSSAKDISSGSITYNFKLK